MKYEKDKRIFRNDREWCHFYDLGLSGYSFEALTWDQFQFWGYGELIMEDAFAQWYSLLYEGW